MVGVQFADVTTGYERFDALSKNLEGIFDKVYQMKEYKLDISYYEKKYNEFKKEFKLNDEMLQNKKMLFEHIQKDYENFVLFDCNKKLENLIDEFERNVTPLYNIYLLFNSIDRSIENGNNDITDIINKTIQLIDKINYTNSHNKIDVTILIERAYKTIYDVLLYEVAFDRQDVLEYLKRKNLSSNRENLSKLLREDVNNLRKQRKISKADIDEEMIKHIEEGLGYDYLSNEFLEKLSKLKLAAKHVELKKQKEDDLNNLVKSIDKYKEKREELLDIIEETQKDIKKVGKSKRSLRFRSLVFVLAPLVFIGSGLVVGKHLSNKHDMYATITRNIDLKTGAVIGEVKKSYNQLELDYEATVTAYGPWRVDNTGNGYLRDVINYTYIPSRELGETYYPTMDNLEGHIREKNRYIETKKELDENDSMTDVVMQVKETYQDRSDTRKSIIPTITLIYVGLVLGVGIDIILCFEGVLDMLHIKHQVEHLRSCLQDDKEIMEAAKIQLALLESKYYYLKEKNDRLFKKYGVRVEMPTYSGGKQI